jgi:trk system potassium uptake protein TrkA
MFNKNSKIENILILGLGGVGFFLAKRLQHEGYAVTAIENNSDRLRYADEALDIRLIKGEAMDIECWREASADKMTCVIAVTDNDAVNMMAAQIADCFGIPSKIARVRSLQYGLEDSLLSAEALKVDLFIHPEELAAQEIARMIKLRDGNEVIDIAQGQIQLLAARISDESVLAGKQLKDISTEFNNFAFRVVAIARGITTIIPSGNIEILPHDQIFVMASSSNLPKLMEMAGVSQGRRQRVMVIGGGLAGSRVAELLRKSVEVKLIEVDADRAKDLSDSLTHVEVLHGDGSKADVLSLAGVHEVDTFISVTRDNETNIMSSLLAKNMMQQQANGHHASNGRTIALVNKQDYQVLAQTIGIDIVLNKKSMAANVIMEYIRGSELFSVAHLHGFDADVVELVAAPNSPITRKPLSKLDSSYHGKILVGAVQKNDLWDIAVGDTHIREHDRVIVICQSMQLKEIRKLFSV